MTALVCVIVICKCYLTAQACYSHMQLLYDCTCVCNMKVLYDWTCMCDSFMKILPSYATGAKKKHEISGSTRFDPGPQHIKVVNNDYCYSLLGTRIFGVGLGLVATVSV